MYVVPISSILLPIISVSYVWVVLTVQQSIPIVMGANIGTSVTNTFVSMVQSGDRDNFRRAFAGATVHDMFNWLTVLVLLPVEVASHYLLHLTGVIVRGMEASQGADSPQFLLAVILPIAHHIIQVRNHYTWL